MATLSGPVTGGRIVGPAAVVAFDLAANGYVEQEYFASGTARAHDGTGDSAPFRTRVVVRRPADAARFSGTVLLEWFNVSIGFDADPDWVYLHEEIFRRGHAYAGVS